MTLIDSRLSEPTPGRDPFSQSQHAGYRQGRHSGSRDFGSPTRPRRRPAADRGARRRACGARGGGGGVRGALPVRVHGAALPRRHVQRAPLAEDLSGRALPVHGRRGVYRRVLQLRRRRRDVRDRPHDLRRPTGGDVVRRHDGRRHLLPRPRARRSGRRDGRRVDRRGVHDDQRHPYRADGARGLLGQHHAVFHDARILAAASLERLRQRQDAGLGRFHAWNEHAHPPDDRGVLAGGRRLGALAQPADPADALAVPGGAGVRRRVQPDDRLQRVDGRPVDPPCHLHGQRAAGLRAEPPHRTDRRELRRSPEGLLVDASRDTGRGGGRAVRAGSVPR